MNRWLVLLVGAGSALTALVLLPRLWRAESSLEAGHQRLSEGTGGARPGFAGSGPGSGPSGQRGTDGGGGTRSRRPSSSGDARGARGDDVATGGDDGEDGGAPGRRGAGREGPEASDHVLPAARLGDQPQSDDGEGDDGGERIPEVAYESGPERVFDTGAQAELSDAGPLSGDAGTVAFWIKPEWAAQSQDDASFVQFGDSGLQVIKNVNFLRFEYIDPRTGQEYGVGTNIGDWQAGDWRHVTASWTGTSLALYVDGKLVSENRFPNPPDFQRETKVYVGSALPGGAQAALGEMMQMTVLNRVTNGTEVAHWYSAGAPRR